MKGKVWILRDKAAPKLRWWAVKAPPHIVIRLKRIFARLKSTHADVLVFSDTLDTARDLEWFLERHPLRISEDDRGYLRARAEEHRRNERAIETITKGRYRGRAFPLALPPRDYQKVAAELALQRGGLLIADDLGIGKTVSALCVLSDPSTRPALVVVLAHLPMQWKREIERFLPGMKVHVLKQATPYQFVDGIPDVIVSSYHKLSGWAETLAPMIRSVVYDEVQELRRGDKSQKGKAAQYLSAHATYRIGLSATPIYNYGGEIHAVIEALQPGALGTWSEFATEWCSGVEEDRYGGRNKAQISDPVAFGTYLRDAGLMIRRTRHEVGRELPGLTRVPQEVDCNRSALEDVAGSAGELARIILDDTGTLAKGEAFKAGGRLDAIVRQATGIAKAPFVADFVRMLLESEEKIILYGWHRSVYEIWKQRLEEFEPLFYTGHESAAAKEVSRRMFVEGDRRLLILSLRAGAGLDGLQQVCRTVVHGELDWSPGVHEQCDGRAFRDGQKDPVFSYYLIASDGSDPIIADVLGVKRGQIEGFRNLGRPDVMATTDASGEHIRRLAERYAKVRGHRHPDAVAPAT